MSNTAAQQPVGHSWRSRQCGARPSSRVRRWQRQWRPWNVAADEPICHATALVVMRTGVHLGGAGEPDRTHQRGRLGLQGPQSYSLVGSAARAIGLIGTNSTSGPISGTSVWSIGAHQNSRSGPDTALNGTSSFEVLQMRLHAARAASPASPARRRRVSSCLTASCSRSARGCSPRHSENGGQCSSCVHRDSAGRRRCADQVHLRSQGSKQLAQGARRGPRLHRR